MIRTKGGPGNIPRPSPSLPPPGPGTRSPITPTR